VDVRQLRPNRPALLSSLVVLAIGLAVLPGCEMQSYSEDMTYPVRSDLADPSARPIVEQPPSADPKGFERPGQWAFMQPIFTETEGKKYDPAKLTSDQRSALQKLLDDRFGRPAKPTVKGLDDEARGKLFLAKDETELNEHLAKGSALYRRHCLHCHGLTGDGHGPTAPWVNPHPRDYRPGTFKFTSTLGGKARKPTRADLTRTLKQGVEGTSMPSFGLLPENEVENLVSYVMHLSLRGQLEYELLRTVFVDAPDPSKMSASAFKDILDLADSTFEERVREWNTADAQPIVTAEFPVKSGDMKSKEGQESIRRGHQLFLGLGVNAASCMSCHPDYGRQLAYKYDSWGSVVRPRDMTAGVFRGGRRPIDIYYRIFNGVNGTPMPAFVSEAEDAKRQAQMAQVWDLVNFIQAVPYPAMLPEDVRIQVYPSDKAGNEHAAAAHLE